ncbi:hypothetical protein CC1G_05892 [Coprinopsis cinerea okayama7|uniref:Uncharacterized protein n=1 Tax=Coprinopsis cinerea (strain Okayama-7 / 130 / ATCC MYA-4618 / FGSC 9003) TaxID=240176 RepID=A8NAE1_COPC7|nr:hypothetical protein CC1G_05892 [Coprinopsis cinerea okayama7\|eukprot:XP_001831793.2 hypothetical protein CC1G_05892 [Coprinopsis cinerea okayama7\
MSPVTGANDDKYSSGHLFVQQPYSLQIIQLTEEPAPPPRKISSYSSSMASSSSQSYWSSSAYTSSACSDDDDDEDEDDEDCSSYCSSDLPPEDCDMAADDDSRPSSSVASPDTYSLRMKRILAWREDFYAQIGASLSETSLPSLKRKLEVDQDEEDSISQSSKRSRSDSSNYSRTSTSVTSLGMHSCPACDAFFDTQQSLRQHGLDAKADNEACSAAVEYEFE